MRTLVTMAGIAMTACAVECEPVDGAEELTDLAESVATGEAPYRLDHCREYGGCTLCEKDGCWGYACYCDEYGCADRGGGCY